MPRKKIEDTAPGAEESTQPKRRRRTADEILAQSDVPEAPAKKPAARKAPAKKAAPQTKESVAEETSSKRTTRKATEGSEDKSAVKRTTRKKAEPAKVERKITILQPEKAPEIKGASVKPKTLAEQMAEEEAQPKKRAPRAKKSPEPEVKKAVPGQPEEKQTFGQESEFGRAIELNWRNAETPVKAKSNGKPKPERPERTESKKAEPRKSVREVEQEPEPELEEVQYEFLPEPVEFGDEEGRVKIVAFREPKVRKVSRFEARKRKPRRGTRDDDKPARADDALREDRVVFRDKQEESVESDPKIEPEPEAPKREPVARTDRSAQVVIQDGLPILIRNRKIIAPLVFFANSGDQVNAQVLEEAKMASENGVHLVSFAVKLYADPAQSKAICEQVERLASAYQDVDDEVEIIVRFQVTAPDKWQESYPDAVVTGWDQPSFYDDDYWLSVEETLSATVTCIKSSSIAQRIVGFHLDANQWTFPGDQFYDESAAGVKAFRKWLEERYRNDVVPLRASWFDGKVNFENAAVPQFGIMANEQEFVRLDRKARPWIDYHLFLSDGIVERIAQLCYTVKKASDADFLVGVTYGFTFEWSHPSSGHLSLGKLLRCPDLDFIAGPPSYRSRLPGDTAGFPFPVDSVSLNGKLYLSEEDYRTPISGTSAADADNPVMKTPQALESAHWRGVGAALAHKGGTIWMDTQGEGWLSSRGIWNRAEKVYDSYVRRQALPATDPEVAVFVDERSLAYLVDQHAFQVLVQDVRESVLRSGLSVGFYLLSDLGYRENFPDSRLYLFLNAWDIRREVRSAIKTKLQRDKKVLFWLYAAGMFESGRENLERTREATGIALKPQPFNSSSGTTVLNTKDALCQAMPLEQLKKGSGLSPSYFAIPEESTVLGEYTQTGLPSMVIREYSEEEKWTSVFLGEPVVTPNLIRALGQMAGCHVWSFENDLVHAAAPYVTVHCSGTGPRILTLPDNWTAYNLTTSEMMPVENNACRFTAIDGSTHAFVVGTLGDVQSYLNADISTMKEFTQPIQHQDNTLHWEAMKFDVEIMKLDEFMEESWTEEMADDLLIKPSMLDIDTEALSEDLPEEDAPLRSAGGRRRDRKRRGGRSGRRGNQRSDGPMDEETGLSFMFRNRE